MYKKILFYLYTKILIQKSLFRLAYFKYLWKDQLIYDKTFVFDGSSSIELLSGKSTAQFGCNVKFRKYCSVICSDNGRLIVGDNVFFNNYCSINCLHTVSINFNTIFGEGVRLYDHNHIFREKNVPIMNQGMKLGGIEIGSNCWIGANTVILSNVKIGNNVVIGANNLIYEDVSDDVLVLAKSEKIVKSLI